MTASDTADAPEPWRVLSSRLIVDDKWMRLRADSCETAEGARIDPFYVIETADVVAVLAVTLDSQIVLVRQYRHGYGAASLEIPAGRIDPGESAIDAATRELREETGFHGGRPRALRTFSPNTLRYANRVHVVLIENVEPGPPTQDDPLERIQTELWPVAKADELMVHPDFANAALAGALAAALFSLNRR